MKARLAVFEFRAMFAQPGLIFGVYLVNHLIKVIINHLVVVMECYCQKCGRERGLKGG